MVLKSYLQCIRYSVFAIVSLLLLSSCGSTVNKTNDYLSVIITDRTKKEIVTDLAAIVSNYGYSLFSETATEVVFETQPDKNSVIAYVKYDKNYRYNYYSGIRNRNIKLPHFQIIFDFTTLDNSIMVESKVEYISWQHKDDLNRNDLEGIEVQKILNELKHNSKMDSAKTDFDNYRSIHHLLKSNIATHKATKYKRKSYLRKVVLSTIDFNRQVKAMLYVRLQIEKYCDSVGGIFEDRNDSAFYSSKGIVIPNVFYNSFNRASSMKAFGIKSCVSEDGPMWRLVIKPKIIKRRKKTDATKITEADKKIMKFKNPELFIHIYMLEKELPTYMKKTG